MGRADAAKGTRGELSADELELAGRAVAEQQLRRLNAEGAARGASELELMVRKWEDEEVAVRKLMVGQHKMFARMTDGAPIGPMVLEPRTPTPTQGLEPSTPGGRASSQTDSPGAGLLLTPSLSLISASPNVQASPAMRKSMDKLMARQAKIWEQVAGTLGTRVSVMLDSPPLKVPSAGDAKSTIHADLPALPPISESVDQLKLIYHNKSPNKKRSKRELSQPKPRTTSSEKTAGHISTRPSAPPASPVRKLAAELNKQSPADKAAPVVEASKQHSQEKKGKQTKRQAAAGKVGSRSRPEWNGQMKVDDSSPKLPLLNKPQVVTVNGARIAGANAGPVRTQSRRPDGADPNLEATQLENKWDEIRVLMVRCLPDSGLPSLLLHS